jgi:hypothetical protein
MSTSMDQERSQAHTYLDQLPPTQLRAVGQLLRSMVGPASSTWTHVPLEDEPIGKDEERTVSEAREWRLHNDPIRNEEVLADLGLSSADFERMRNTPVAGDADPR